MKTKIDIEDVKKQIEKVDEQIVEAEKKIEAFDIPSSLSIIELELLIAWNEKLEILNRMKIAAIKNEISQLGGN